MPLLARLLCAILLTALMLAGAPQPAPAEATSAGQAASEPSAQPAGAEAGATSRSIVAQRDQGAGRRGDGALDRVMLWIEARQRDLNRALTGSVRELKAKGSAWAALVLAGIGFLYGVLHAAGPGHGKAIITSYVLADGRTLKRGIAVAFMAGFIQALSAIVLVGLLAVVLGATGQAIQAASNRLEQASYVLIALIGGYLLWRAVLDALQGRPTHGHAGAVHAHGPHGHAGHDHDHEHAHAPGEACSHCGHTHLPGPQQLVGQWSWSRAIALAAAVGVRPCTGAIIVLVFALSQGMLWAGVWATLAMALGTAITVSALAAMTVGARGVAVQMTGGSGPWASRIEAAAGIGGAGLVLVLGLLFFLASLGPTRPF